MEKNNDPEDISPVQTEINALTTMNKNLTTVPKSVTDAEIKSPISSVENSLSQFVQDSFDVTRKDFEFNQSIQDEILSRLPEFKNAELIALLTNNKVNDNDRINKILAPTFQLMTAKQQAEIAALSAQKNDKIDDLKSANMREINEDTDQKVLQGMTMLKNLIDAVQSSANKIADDQKKLDEEKKSEKIADIIKKNINS